MIVYCENPAVDALTVALGLTTKLGWRWTGA